MTTEPGAMKRSPMEKFSLSEPLARLYTAPETEVIAVEVPELRFLMVDGAGDPTTSDAFRTGAHALFAIAEAIAALVRTTTRRDLDIMPLEGLWWVEDPSQFSLEDKSNWQWTLMIMQLEIVTEAMVEQVRGDLARDQECPAVSAMRFATFREGQAAQILHRGPHADEWPKMEQVHRFIEKRGGQPRGKHHEIYLQDVFHVPTEALITIIRQPFA
jgi:hypothetical protein